jgi:hypothetical protein
MGMAWAMTASLFGAIASAARPFGGDEEPTSMAIVPRVGCRPVTRR